jgi:hypothetical protein
MKLPSHIECAHTSISCINPYELIRKYRCTICGEIMMCSCEEEFARRFLPHQLKYGKELKTRLEIPVTLGFQKGICNACKGLPEKAHPAAPMFGRSSKIVRYYWREIAFETIRRFAEWAESQGYTDWATVQIEYKDIRKYIEREVIKEIKELHERCPKYIYQEESQSDILEKYQIELVRLDALCVKHPEFGVSILDGEKTYSPEEFAVLYFERIGYKSIFTESVPFHALFGIFMWLLIQDPLDPYVRMAVFGDPCAFEARTSGEMIWTPLPSDFGSPVYAHRRVSAIEKHFAFLPKQKNELLWLFDYWLEPSYEFRQYLWAHRHQDVKKAREIILTIPVDITLKILRYLVADYWGRYCGWPDLLVHKNDYFFFAEIKLSKDRLSEDQKNWIRGNSTEIQLPFKLVKIHKKIITGRR